MLNAKSAYEQSQRVIELELTRILESRIRQDIDNGRQKGIILLNDLIIACPFLEDMDSIDVVSTFLERYGYECNYESAEEAIYIYWDMGD